MTLKEFIYKAVTELGNNDENKTNPEEWLTDQIIEEWLIENKIEPAISSLVCSWYEFENR